MDLLLLKLSAVTSPGVAEIHCNVLNGGGMHFTSGRYGENQRRKEKPNKPSVKLRHVT